YSVQLFAGAAAPRGCTGQLDRARANDRRHRRRRSGGARAASASRRALLRIHARRWPVADGGDGPRHLPPAHRATARALPAEVHRSRRRDPGLRSLDEDLRGHDLQPAMTSAKENELLTRTGAGTGSFLPVANRRNDYLIDRAAQKARCTFSGALGVGVQTPRSRKAWASSPIGQRSISWRPTRASSWRVGASSMPRTGSPGAKTRRAVRAMPRVAPRAVPVEEVLA